MTEKSYRPTIRHDKQQFAQYHIARADSSSDGGGSIGTSVAGALLRVQNVGVRFGGIVALDDVSFDVPAGCIVGLIGPNGAGKTTLFNCLSRLYQCDNGDILFDGSSLLKLPRHRIAGAGIGRTFQNLALFRTMTVLDNVMVGRHCRTAQRLFRQCAAPARGRARRGGHARATRKR